MLAVTGRGLFQSTSTSTCTLEEQIPAVRRVSANPQLLVICEMGLRTCFSR